MPSEKSQPTASAPDCAQLDGRDTRAGGEIQHALAGLQLQALSGALAPPPVQAAGEHRVGQVVTPRHTVEHRGDVVRLLVQRGEALAPLSIEGAVCQCVNEDAVGAARRIVP